MDTSTNSDLLGPVVTHVDGVGKVLSENYRRPFLPLDATLRQVLLDDFARPALSWLFGASGDPSPSMSVDAHAEVALSVIGGVNFLRSATDPGQRDEIAEKVGHAAAWLCEKASEHEDGSCCWDHSAWDTAAVTRALCQVLRQEETRAVVERAGKIDDVQRRVLGGLTWLLVRLRLADGRHAATLLNPGEYAEIGRTIAELLVWDAAATEKTVRATGDRGVDEIVDEVCNILIRRRSERMIEIATEDGSTEVATIWWGDFFGTSEVLRFYMALNAALVEGAIDLPSQTRHAIRESVAKCLLLIENSHYDGLWGAYLDTIALLGAYVEIGECDEGLFADLGRPERLTAQPRIVFRVLRWMCDPTQRSSDGSVLHTAFLTTFFALTVIDVAAIWRFSSAPIAIVYDEMCLLMETGVSEYRAGQISAVLARDEALVQLDEVRELVDVERRRNAYERWLRSRFIGSAVVLVTLGMVVGLVGQLTGLVNVTVDGRDTGDLLALVGVGATVVLAVIGVIWTMGRPPD